MAAVYLVIPAGIESKQFVLQGVRKGKRSMVDNFAPEGIEACEYAIHAIQARARHEADKVTR